MAPLPVFLQSSNNVKKCLIPIFDQAFQILIDFGIFCDVRGDDGSQAFEFLDKMGSSGPTFAFALSRHAGMYIPLVLDFD